MLQSTRDFLKDVNKQLHDTRVGKADFIKALEIGEDAAASEQRRLEREEAKEREQKRLMRGDYTRSEQLRQLHDYKTMLGDLNNHIKAGIAEQSKIFDKFNKNQMNQAGKEQIEKLLEITERREDYLNKLLEDAENKGNELLVEHYTQEKTENHKELLVYREKYEAYKDNE